MVDLNTMGFGRGIEIPFFKEYWSGWLKTGHIKESGYHLTATAKRDGQRMIAVVMVATK